jgi:hypothetical protein
MNFTTIFVPFFCLGLILVPLRTNLAKEISDLRFLLVDDVNIFCPPEEEGDVVEGCIIFEKKIVYIRKGLNPERQRFVVAHEIGHYYLQYVPPEDLEEMIAGEIGGAPVLAKARICSAANEKRKNDVVEMSADLFNDYSKGDLEEKYPKIKELYDSLMTM